MPSTSRSKPSSRLVLIVAALLVSLIAIIWSFEIMRDKPAGEIEMVTSPTTAPPVAIATPPVSNILDRAGLDPVPVASAAPEPTLEELVAAADRAPPPELTPEEMAAGRKTLRN